jgi:hypothetical protein
MKAISASVAVLLAIAGTASADDEIQIYNAQIAAVGQWPNHALNGDLPTASQLQRSTAAKSRIFPVDWCHRAASRNNQGEGGRRSPR